MVHEPVPPIIVDENGDLQVFSALASATRQLEPIDVQDGVYEAFDSRGYRLQIEAVGDQVFMRIPAGSAPRLHELDVRVRRLVERIGPERMGLTSAAAAPLSELLELLLRLERGEFPRMKKPSAVRRLIDVLQRTLGGN